MCLVCLVIIWNTKITLQGKNWTVSQDTYVSLFTAFMERHYNSQVELMSLLKLYQQ